MGEVLLRTQYKWDSSEAGPTAEFLWGLSSTPEWLLLGGNVRVLAMERKIGKTPLAGDLILMQSDVEATVQVAPIVALVSIGYAPEGAVDATLTRDAEPNLVSRQHWFGVYLDKGQRFLFRLGRLNLPFGLRSIEHTLWARDLTSTNINDDQQHGLALAYSGERLRGELMAIAGNYQTRPDDFRERGYSGYLEWLADPRLALGASSMIAHRDLDPQLRRETWRHAHGAFVRWATGYEPLVLLSEWDYVLRSPRDSQWREGVVGFVQADLEAVQGMHFIATAEAHNVGVNGPPASLGGWLSYHWFFAPHADLRIDAIYQSLAAGPSRTDAVLFLTQAHVYL